MILKENSTDQKLRGSYYTPIELANAIVTKFCCDEPKRILEPSCGDGVFIDALEESGLFARGASITAIDNDSNAVAKAERRYHGRQEISIGECDFFDFCKTEQSATYDLVIGNPPYIRYQYLESSQRQTLSNILTAHGMRANKLINAWVGFMVSCTDLLHDDGLLLFVVPAEILQVVYAEDLRLFLSKSYREITLIAFDKLVFPDIEQEVVVFAGRKGNSTAEIRVVRATDTAEFVATDLSGVPFQPLHRVHEKWTKYFIGASDARVLASASSDKRMVRFDSLALVNVGITTGNNKFFSLDEDTTERYDLAQFTMPLIGRSSHASGAYFTETDWKSNVSRGKLARLLVLKDGQYSELSERQRSYIDEGARRGENGGYKCSIRDSWYSVPSVWVPDAFFLRRNNLFPKFVLNACGAVSTDTMHRIKFYEGVDPRLVLIGYYSSVGLAYAELCGRSYGGGVLEILPKEVGNMLLPSVDLAHLSEEEIKHYVGFIDETLRMSLPIEALLDRIDSEILVGRMAFENDVCAAYRRVWTTLRNRRLGRAN